MFLNKCTLGNRQVHFFKYAFIEHYCIFNVFIIITVIIMIMIIVNNNNNYFI